MSKLQNAAYLAQVLQQAVIINGSPNQGGIPRDKGRVLNMSLSKVRAHFVDMVLDLASEMTGQTVVAPKPQSPPTQSPGGQVAIVVAQGGGVVNTLNAANEVIKTTVIAGPETRKMVKEAAAEKSSEAPHPSADVKVSEFSTSESDAVELAASLEAAKAKKPRGKKNA